MFNNSSIYSESWCSSVFANRNQAYGAYDLRKVNDRYTLFGLLLTSSLVLSTSLYITFRNHGTPPTSSIASMLMKEKTDTLQIFEIQLEEKQKAIEAPPAAVDPDPVKPAPTPTVSENAPIQIVKEVKETDKPPVTNVAASEATPSNTNASSTGSTNTAISGNGTSGTEGSVGGTGTEPMKIVEHMPEFPGGNTALMGYIRSNVIYPEVAKEMEKEGTVYVTFVVERNGEVSNVRVEKSIYKALDTEAMRVVKSLPKWKPGSQNGQTVRVQFTVPIRFLLS